MRDLALMLIFVGLSVLSHDLSRIADALETISEEAQ